MARRSRPGGGILAVTGGECITKSISPVVVLRAMAGSRELVQVPLANTFNLRERECSKECEQGQDGVCLCVSVCDGFGL